MFCLTDRLRRERSGRRLCTIQRNPSRRASKRGCRVRSFRTWRTPSGEFAPESFFGVLLSGNAFNFLGVPPVAGRTIQPTDIRADGQAEPVVVLSYRLWVRLFDGNPAAVGRTLVLNGRPHTIIGVMPPRFGWYGSDGFWLPLSATRTDVPGIFVVSAFRRNAGGAKFRLKAETTEEAKRL